MATLSMKIEIPEWFEDALEEITLFARDEVYKWQCRFWVTIALLAYVVIFPRPF